MQKTSYKYEVIHNTLEDSPGVFSISILCELAGVSRSGYYAWLKAAPTREARELQDKADFELILVESSIEYDMRGAILGNINTQSGGEKLTKTISKYINDSSQQWVEKGKRGELSANIMLPYVQLYQVLKIETDLLIRYNQYLGGLK